MATRRPGAICRTSRQIAPLTLASAPPQEAIIYLSRLKLTNFRNFRSLDLALPPGISVFQGLNGQGKTNLLDAAYLLATTRPPRSGAEADLIHWDVRDDPASGQAFARLEGDVRRDGERAQLAQVLQVRGVVADPSHLPTVERRFLINGSPRRAADVIGVLLAVWFGVPDIDLIGGPPSSRRRFLDILNSQLDPQYYRALQRYQRALAQRNHLLKMVRAGQARQEDIASWDDPLVASGSYILERRAECLRSLDALARAEHGKLTSRPSLQGLTLDYRPSFPIPPGDEAGVASAFRQRLQELQDREVRMAMTLAGPHRDDLRFLVDGRDMWHYGSRGEQRLIALSLRLGEAQLLRQRRGEEPVLLLDDALSELDEPHRNHLLASIQGRGQVLITATDLQPFPPEFLEKAARFRVVEGRVEGA